MVTSHYSRQDYLESKQELDMGSPFDFFGDISHHDSPRVLGVRDQLTVIKGHPLDGASCIQSCHFNVSPEGLLKTPSHSRVYK